MLIDRKQGQLLLPDFFIVGAARSGTTSLCYYLREHREIHIPDEKEPEFFNFPGDMRLEQYSRLFSGAQEGQRIGEATASYLYHHEKSIDRMLRVYGEKSKALKMIAILRNPIERAWSYFQLERRMGKSIEFFTAVSQYEKETGKHFHDFIRSGMYSEQVAAYRNVFPQVRLFLFDDLIARPEQVLSSVYDFLELSDRSFVPGNLKTVYNASGKPRRAAYGPIYRFLFERNALKSRLKNVLPDRLRQRLKSAIANRIIDKAAMPEDVRAFLKETFFDEIRAMDGFFESEREKAVVRAWLDS